MLPKVSVVIPFYNCPYVGLALESVLYQTYPNIEIIVVDDGSTAMVDLLKPYLPYIRYIRKPNGGTASALNAGIKQAAGEYIAWLSADDLFYATKIARQMTFMLKRKAKFSFTDFNIYIQEHHTVAHRDLPVISDYQQFAKRFIDECPINGCTVIMKKELLDRIGLFDESLPYTHDYDLWVRILLSGCRMHFLKEYLTLYRYHPDMGSRKYSAEQMAEFERTKQKYRAELLHFMRFRTYDK